MEAVASVQWDKRNLFYVSETPGHDSKGNRLTGSERNSDWGYTLERGKAIRLNVYWQRRFNADSRRCGRVAKFEPID
jgi:hypothetical protein